MSLWHKNIHPLELICTAIRSRNFWRNFYHCGISTVVRILHPTI